MSTIIKKPILKLRKKKLDESILAKSKRFVKDTDKDIKDHSPSSIVNKEGKAEDSELAAPPPPTKKIRKPRHASVEGQRFLKLKEKARIRDGLPQLKRKAEEVEDSSTPIKKKKGKKKKKKSKSKKITTELNNSSSKDPSSSNETEERYKKEALAYLQLWKNHRDHWKFEKLKQVWLLKHALNSGLVDDDRFETLLEYVESIKGAAREKTMREMEGFISEFEGKFGSGNKNSLLNVMKKDDGEPEEPEKGEYDRARKIVQMLCN